LPTQGLIFGYQFRRGVPLPPRPFRRSARPQVPTENKLTVLLPRATGVFPAPFLPIVERRRYTNFHREQQITSPNRDHNETPNGKDAEVLGRCRIRGDKTGSFESHQALRATHGGWSAMRLWCACKQYLCVRVSRASPLCELKAVYYSGYVDLP
jgi:hypothetical protein